jgi:aspartate racemase
MEKTVGIIGGIGPESTIVYYNSIISLYRSYVKNGHYPQIILNSIDMKKMLDLIVAEKNDDVTGYLVQEVTKLAKAGAHFGLLASNTPHIVFEHIQAQSPIPLISIVDVTCQRAKHLELKKVGLFGTKFTMESRIYQKRCAYDHITVVNPDVHQREYIHEKYMHELVNGIIREQTKHDVLDIIHSMQKTHGIQGIILGGTELTLLFHANDDIGIPWLDTTQIHVESIVERLL